MVYALKFRTFYSSSFQIQWQLSELELTKWLLEKPTG